ncbi:RNA 3'-terminal phosphate cyclase [Microbulbifer sp. OS29]|uniref:RNA 3'-terminal phosphate cyclase n=1 Tax=Microbulbifer okhotskensis TaxID=2926617 RepID=A0A9X2ENA4_9GAMM|nr:RNA 3'-terminal phosphate cyclase [Microbulbifer okhotskensis]MCO1335374.1 RNA 3'-terminal phosphate cyclase [Microbulbifer okhotskensis]
MIEIDGAQGEGGGQILRSTLSLSLCLGTPIKIKNIRAGRKKPGLLRQHLTCLRAAKTISNAVVTGEQLGASEVTFVPGTVRPGDYHFPIGSAGSTSLVLQTVLLPLLFADEVSEVSFEGGTHNKKAPSFDFIAEAYLPLLARMGAQVEVALDDYGFYPAGGGTWRARIQPLSQLSALQLTERGELLDYEAVATSAHIPAHVAQRELAQVRKKCDWPAECLHQRQVPSQGPGNLLSLRLRAQQITEVFEAMAKQGVSAERVADGAIRQMQRYIHAGVPVGEHLADQLILPMALGAGGSFVTLKPSLHLRTNIDVIHQLTGAQIDLQEEGLDQWRVLVHSHKEKQAA